MNEELKPCICGGEAKFHIYDNGLCDIRCDCGICVSYRKIDEYEQVIKTWNTRAERTCHPTGDWEPVSQTQKVRRRICDCGYELGIDRVDLALFNFSKMCELPNYCPNCGVKVI